MLPRARRREAASAGGCVPRWSDGSSDSQLDEPIASQRGARAPTPPRRRSCGGTAGNTPPEQLIVESPREPISRAPISAASSPRSKGYKRSPRSPRAVGSRSRYSINESADRPKYCQVVPPLLSMPAVPLSLPLVSPRTAAAQFVMRNDHPPQEQSLWYYGQPPVRKPGQPGGRREPEDALPSRRAALGGVSTTIYSLGLPTSQCSSPRFPGHPLPTQSMWRRSRARALQEPSCE